MSESPKSKFEGATMYITFKSYLKGLEEIEASRDASQRRTVPTMGEVAKDIGITDVAMSNIATGKIQQLSLKTAGKIIAAMRARGFQMDVHDLIAYRPAENSE